MYCSNCGTAMPGTAAFCPNCGNKSSGQDAAAQPPGYVPPKPAPATGAVATEISAFGYFKRCITGKYATVQGRARRREYWYFTLFVILFAMLLGFTDGLLGLANEETGIGPLLALGFLAVIVPSIAVQVRRLHDTNRSGWWILLNFVPYVGALVLFVFMVLDSQPGENRYGPNPKA